jgi:hypothetical protein
MLNEQGIVRRFEEAQDRLVLASSDLSLGTLSEMVTGDAVDIRPHYQRRDRWSAEKRAALIESFLLNIPVPPLYLAEETFGAYSVIDGKQRLTAIRDFMADNLALRGLETFTQLEGFTFSQLPSDLANALRIRPYLRVVTLLKQSDPNLKFEVFHRLNTGGERLNAQEIRNVIFQGPLNDLIIGDLANDSFLRRQLKIKSDQSPAYRTMQDAEYVLRFLTLWETWQSFSGDLGQSMTDFMERHQHPDSDVLGQYKRVFSRALGWCENLWGEHAFNRPAGSGWRDQTLAGMYDAQMLAVANLENAQLEALRGRQSEVERITRRLFKDAAFDTAVRQGTNTPARVRYRIEELTNALGGVSASAL